MLVVAIGASAGGLAAMKSLLSKLPDDAQKRSMAFVVVQHAELSGPRLGCETIADCTDLPAVEIADRAELTPGQIYFVPPQKIFALKNGRFALAQAKNRAQRASAIDACFREIAKAYGRKSVGLILSGEGTDGVQGIKAISEAGGMIMAQAPESAERPSMPESALFAGVVDRALRPEEMGAELSAYSVYLARATANDETESKLAAISSALLDICDILHKRTSHDFKHYKTGTLIRRIQRRMQVLQLNSVESYVDRLEQDEPESEALFKELLINVTDFFRDPEAFKALAELAIKPLLQKREATEKIRVWVAGCSTGEEAYSVAMLIREALDESTEKPEVQVIATDIDEAALRAARRGVYSADIAQSVGQERLARFFVQKGGRYHVVKEIREMCLFSAHNLINDPPFPQLDLICCRNLLIYLGPHLQQKLIPVFHYALKPKGFLFLGASENLSTHRELFDLVSAKFRVARKRPVAVRVPGSFSGAMTAYPAHAKDAAEMRVSDLHLIAQRIVLDEFSPKYAIVDDESQIVSVSGGLEAYLAPSEGVFQNRLLKLVHPSLRVSLRTTFSEACKQKRKIVDPDAILKTESEIRRLEITVQPMPRLGESAGLFMVIFRELGVLAEAEKAASSGEASSALVEQMEKELSVLRGDLDRVVEDLETSNENLKASNEELLSMNEELQSTNEELVVSREQVQAANEALQKGNADLENLLASTEIATLFLDEDLRIRSFTPEVGDIYAILDRDIGRPIGDLTCRARNMPEFPSPRDISRSQRNEVEVSLPDGRIFLRRSMPYQTHDHKNDGIVVVFVDVTALRRSEGIFQTLANTTPAIVWTADSEGRVDFLNEQWFQYTGLAPGSSYGSNWLAAMSPASAKKFETAWEKAVKENVPLETEIYLRRASDGAQRLHLCRARPLPSGEGDAASKWCGTFFDIQRRQDAEEVRVESEKLFRTMADAAPVLIWIAGLDKSRRWFNKTWLEFVGRPIEQEIGDGWAENIHPEDKAAYLEAYEKGFDAREEFQIDYRLRHHGHGYRWVKATGVPLWRNDGAFDGYIGACMDFHESKIAEEAVKEGEEQFRAMVNSIPQLAWMADSKGDIFWFNDRCYEFSGAEFGELKGWGWSKLHDPKVAGEITRRWGEAVARGEPWEDTFRLRSRDGSWRWFLSRAIPIRDKTGTVIQWFGTNTDIDERRQAEEAVASSEYALKESYKDLRETVENMARAEEALRRSEDRYRTLAETLPQLVWTCAPDGKCVYLSKQWVDYTGIPEELQLGSRWLDALHPDDRERTREHWRGVVKGLHPYDLEYRLRRADGAYRWYKVRATPMTGADGVILSWFGTCTDNHDQKLIGDELVRAKLAAERANEAKTAFLANMSHEIRTPLGAICGFSELLQSAFSEDPVASDYLSRIVRNSSQLTHLIDELLDLSKIEADRFEIEIAAFDPRTVIDDVVSTCGFRAKEKGLDFQMHLDDLPTQAVSDPARLRQILLNVIGNAVKFTERGKIETHVSAVRKDDRTFLEFKISDTGIGLLEEHQGRIFDPFTQADSSIKRRFGGTGLGLSLSRRLARLLNGDLVLEKSAVGEGSVFNLTIDISRPLPSTLAKSPLRGDDYARQDSAKAGAAQHALEGVRVLVVDDAPDNLTIVARYLEKEGALVETANDGEEAVKKALKGQFQVILMDLQMPGVDGLQAIARLRGNAYRGAVIALTAHAMAGEKERCISQGFDDYFSKPIDRKGLIAMVQRYSRGD